VTSTRRRTLSAASGAAAVLAAVGGAVGYYASRLTRPPVDVPPRRPRVYDLVTIEEIDDGSVVLTGPDATRPGVWGLAWEDGHARVGSPTPLGDGRARRPIDRLTGSPAVAGTPAMLDAYVTTEDPADTDRPYHEVTYDSPLGPTPAVWFPAEGSSTWAVFVHGRSARLHEGFRLAPGLVDAGLHLLTIAYRDDPDAPRSPDGRSHLGDTEWEDVEAAIAFALDHGATDVVLVGYSMGGGIAATCARRSPLARHVRALVLDAPVLDWAPVIRWAARERGVPGAVLPMLLPASMALASVRAGIDWHALTHHPESITIPTLLVHGDRDSTVPVALADELAAARPDLVRYVRVAGAGHCRSWNHDPEGYEAAVLGFVTEQLTTTAA
jgi:pimeloyl-ACP methyl ester carboxylesterase